MAISNIELLSETGERFTAYLALPTQPSGHAVIILQEIFGVNATIRAIADNFSAAGYIAIAPDLFWRQRPGVQLDPNKPEDREAATGLMKGLDQSRAVADALIAASHLRGMPHFSGKVAAVGYCLGGKLAYLLATHAEIDAAVAYYGVGIQGALAEAAHVRCPILLHIAGADHLCPIEAQAAIKAAVAPLGSQATVLDYPGLGHAFARKGAGSYDASAAKRADDSTYQFLAKTLGQAE